LTPRLPLYFDFVQDSSHRVGRRWEGGFNPLKRVYDFAPSELHKPGEKELIKGIQAALWTERISARNKLENMLFPRISALAEAAWTVDANKNYNLFESRLRDHIGIYRKD